MTVTNKSGMEMRQTTVFSLTIRQVIYAGRRFFGGGARLEQGTHNSRERVSAFVFTGLHTVADARRLNLFEVSPRCAESESFAIKNPEALENDRESSQELSHKSLRARAS
jgi:hypothetical protein